MHQHRQTKSYNTRLIRFICKYLQKYISTPCVWQGLVDICILTSMYRSRSPLSNPWVILSLTVWWISPSKGCTRPGSRHRKLEVSWIIASWTERQQVLTVIWWRIKMHFNILRIIFSLQRFEDNLIQNSWSTTYQTLDVWLWQWIVNNKLERLLTNRFLFNFAV